MAHRKASKRKVKRNGKTKVVRVKATTVKKARKSRTGGRKGKVSALRKRTNMLKGRLASARKRGDTAAVAKLQDQLQANLDNIASRSEKAKKAAEKGKMTSAEKRAAAMTRAAKAVVTRKARAAERAAKKEATKMKRAATLAAKKAPAPAAAPAVVAA